MKTISEKETYIAIFFLSVLFTAGCIFGGKKPTLLFQGYMSHTKFDEVKANLKKKGMSFAESIDSKISENDKRPPFLLKKIAVEKFKFKSTKGKLVFEFYNNQLCCIEYQPENVSRFIYDFYELSGIRIVKKQKIKIHANTIIFSNENYMKKVYFRFYDQALEKEIRNWLMKHS